ncbi:trypsin-like serine protease [Altererythrobacter aerius]|uniref:Trypsin-like serine protease n=1 Tax=Tsuneonella aeria TaxID=1837929 RepID=A0A6I4TBN9_9SPHN|nr:serine protease [Tsuneonella aeria]MXO74463.1 trypsin-like serine protease [Tsuneonella aeria]
MIRMFRALAALILTALSASALAEPADITAAARGVVRVVIVGTDGETIYPMSHGSGFAISPTRVVTNAHVLEEAANDPTTRIAIVPSDGGEADFARIVAVNSAKDLALLELMGDLRLPALTLSGIAATDGDEVSAVGYPMNVDRAQGLDIADLFRSQPPVKSRGHVSGSRPSRDVDTVLHTAAIARGNSGGPLLDACGRVLGVNSFGTASDEGGDAEFSFAVSGRELAAFLRAASVPVPVNALPCRSMAQLDAAERERLASEQAAARADLARRAETSRERRERARLEAEMAVLADRENAMAMAGLLILLAAAAGFAAYQFRSREDGGKAMRIAGAVAAAALVGALAIWFTRPGLDAIDRRVSEILAGEEGDDAAGSGDGPESTEGEAAKLTCTLDPERSRVVGEPPVDLAFEWAPGGCVNGRTQYGFADGAWTRLFVPDGEDTVSINRFDPRTRTFRTDRYPLSRAAMRQARESRAAYQAPACGADDAARTLGERQSAVAALLPAQPTERIVRQCRPR